MISIFYSSQRAMAQAALKKKIKEVLPEKDEMNYAEVDLTFSTTDEIVYECENLSFCYDKKTVVAYNATFLEKGKAKGNKTSDNQNLIDYLSNPNPSVDLYFVVYSDEIDTKSEYYKLIEKTSPNIVGVTKLNDQEWIKYITNYFKKKNIKMDLDAAYEFLARFGGDYSAFMSYAEKLENYASESLHISKAEIEELVAAPLEENAFLLSNALCKGNKKEALKIYKDLLVTSGKDIEISLLSLLSNQFRILNQVRYLDQEEGYKVDQIASILKISLGRVKASLMNLRNMNDRTSIFALENIYETEKDIFSGKIQADVAFPLFIVNFKLRP